MNKKILAKKRFFNVLRNIPFGVYVLIVAALLVAVVVLSAFIIKKLLACEDEGQYVQLIVGLVASILSFVLCLNAIFGNIIVRLNNKKKENSEKAISVSNYIRDFNNNVLDDLTIAERIVKRLEKNLGFQFSFNPSLQNQEENIKKYKQQLQNSGRQYDDVLLYSIATVFYTNNSLAGNAHMIKFAENVIQANSGSSASAKSYVQTIGGSGFLAEFRRMRIKVLNYFERMAVEYANGSISEELANAQFKDILISIIPLFYYLIYIDEGLNSYPYLNVMLQKMQY